MQPVRGPVFGTIVVGLFGLIAMLSGRREASLTVLGAYLLAGALGGGLVGLTLPLWRGRILAGAFAGAAYGVTYGVLEWRLGEFIGVAYYLFLGVAAGLAFGVLLWRPARS